MIAQSSFRKLSRPEKYWVISHPIIAKKAQRISKQIVIDVDSIKKSGIIGTDNNGGKLDAFKHAYWMAFLRLEIGSKKALKLGKAHEKGNYLQWKKHELEGSILPDSISSEMDLKNNEVGAFCFGNCTTIRSKTEIQGKIFRALKEGKLFTIKKDANGNYLTCNQEVINLKQWAGKWDVPKCIVPSNE